MTLPRRINALLAIPLGLAAVPAPAPAGIHGNSQETTSPLPALRALDVRLLSVGTRLAIANAPICVRRERHAGLLVHHLSQYARRTQPAAAAAFALGDHAGVLALAEGGPAQRAGLRLDDTIVSADGQALPRPPAGTAGSFAPTERIIAALEAAFADGAAELVVQRSGERRTVRVPAEEGCVGRFQVVPSGRLHAGTDGRTVQLTSATVEFTANDEELAAFVAHELAHVILRHRARLNAAGMDRGLLAPFGRNGRLSRRTELEADRLTAHLMARAGYDPRAAVRLWTRQSRRGLQLFAGTHPDWGDRIAALNQEIAAIESARARGEQAVPPLPDGPLSSAPGVGAEMRAPT